MYLANWPAEFEEILRRYLPFAGPEPIRPEHRLAELGLDSLGTVSMLLDVEEGFDISVPDELLIAETFATAGGLWATIEKVQG